MNNKKVYIASSFKHIHGVQLLSKRLEELGYIILDWTRKAVVPEGLTPIERREWMDRDDNGGTVFEFCRNSCTTADLVIYLGQSGQDAGVEVGMAKGKNIPILGIRGPLESAGLMLYGSCSYWVETIDKALECLEEITHISSYELEKYFEMKRKGLTLREKANKS